MPAPKATQGTSGARIAALFIADFPLQALLRASPERAHEPLAVVRGRLSGGAELVAVTAPAQQLGVGAGMTVAQARARVPELVVVLRDPALERSATDALADVARSFSPRIEIGRGGEAGWAFLDAAGLERLVGTPAQVARALLRAAGQVGLNATVGVARTCTLARLAALGGDGCAVVPPDAEAERQYVAPLPLAVLEPSAELAATLHRFGLVTVGELVALPAEEISERLGPEGVALHRRARGEEEGGGLRPMRSPARFREQMSLEYGIDNLEPLSFVLRGLLDRLMQRLSLCGYQSGDLELSFEHDGAGRSVRTVRVSAASRDVRALLALCRLALEKEPPEQAVVRVAVDAAPVVARPRQLSLFEPAGPAPDKLAVTVARLIALCGNERVGSPQPCDSYRDDAFAMVPFAPPPASGAQKSEAPSVPPLMLRRFRPPLLTEVIWERDKLVRLEGREVSGRVVSCNGPFRRSDEWWTDERRDDEPKAGHDLYDVQLVNGTTYRLAHDQGRDRWLVVGWYD